MPRQESQIDCETRLQNTLLGAHCLTQICDFALQTIDRFETSRLMRCFDSSTLCRGFSCTSRVATLHFVVSSLAEGFVSRSPKSSEAMVCAFATRLDAACNRFLSSNLPFAFGASQKDRVPSRTMRGK